MLEKFLYSKGIESTTKGGEFLSAKTISITKGKGSIQHNNRQFLTENIDRQRVRDNIVYVKQDIKEAYQQVFGKAVEEYNAKQKRKDRKIEDYYEKVRQSKNGEQLFHEIIVQVGDMEDSGADTEDFKKCRDVLDLYMKYFQERNPHIHVFNAVMHLDESTPHLHIDFIPIGEGYKRGLAVKNSLNKAMEPYAVGDKVGIVGWYEREREVLTECAKRYNIKITHKNERRRDLSLPEYKKTMEELERLKEAKKELKNDIEELEHIKSDSNLEKREILELKPKKVLGRVSLEDYEELRKVTENYRSKLTLIEVENKELKQEIKRAKTDRQGAVKEVDQLKRELFESKEEVKRLNKEREGFKKKIEHQMEQTYQEQIDSLKIDVSLEKEINRGLSERIEEVKQEKETLVERVTNEWKEKYNQLDSRWRERYSKLESALEGVKQKFDEYKQRIDRMAGWRKEFFNNHSLSEVYLTFMRDKQSDYALAQKWEKELSAKYCSRDFVKEEVERRLKIVRRGREDNRMLEKLKQDDPAAYQKEMMMREEVDKHTNMSIKKVKSKSTEMER